MIDLTSKTAKLIGGQDDLLRQVGARLRAAGATLTDADLAPDIAVLNPGWRQVGAFMDSTPEDWDAALVQNFEQVVYDMQIIARQMIERGGSIIVLSSVATLMPLVETSVMGTTLAMLRPIVKMAAVDLGQYAIRVNAVAAGWVETAANESYFTPEGRAFIEEGIPLGRVATSQEIGDVCCFLASDLSRYMTGSVITADGGYTLTRSPGESPYP